MKQLFSTGQAPSIAVSLLHESGAVYSFPSQLELAQYLGYWFLHAKRLGTSFRQPFLDSEMKCLHFKSFEWMAMEGGKILTNEDLLKLLPLKISWAQKRKKEREQPEHLYRKSPVFGCSAKRQKFPNRDIHKHQFLRDTHFKEEGVPELRAKLKNRYKKELRHRRWTIEKSWKKYRNNQWKN